MRALLFLWGLMLLLISPMPANADFSDIRSPILKEAVEFFQKHESFPFQGASFFSERSITALELKALFLAAEKNIEIPKFRKISKKTFFSLLQKSGIAKKLPRVRQGNLPITRGEAVLAIFFKGEVPAQRAPSRAKEALISCPLCVNGVDLSKFPWSKSPAVKIEGGKLMVGVFNETSLIENGNIRPELLDRITEMERRHTLQNAPRELKMKVDQLFPEYYSRAIGIHGGLQGIGNSYGHFENPAANLSFIARTSEKKSIQECYPSCEFEVQIISWYVKHQTPLPPFESFIKSSEAKPFIFDVIHRAGFADIYKTLQGQ